MLKYFFFFLKFLSISVIYLLLITCYSSNDNIHCDKADVVRTNKFREITHTMLATYCDEFSPKRKENYKINKNYINLNINSCYFFFFYTDDSCVCCLEMRKTLQDFTKKYPRAVIYAIPVVGGKTTFNEFFSYREIDKEVLEWTKPLPSLLLYDDMTEDCIYISNSVICLNELEKRLDNYFRWTDNVEGNLFVKLDCLDMFFDEIKKNPINFNEYQYTLRNFNKKL